MKRTTRSIIATLLSLSCIAMPIPPAKACAPDLAYAILINGNHPDLPLKLFAGGNIGIIQPGWAKSYLVVAYRYLSGKPLSKLEQDSVIKLWHERIISGSRFDSSVFVDQKDAYLKLRAKAIGANPKNNPEIYWKLDSYTYEHGIGDSAFAYANVTLANLLKKYPPKSQQIRDWVKIQDDIFGIATHKDFIPPALPKSADPLLQDARNYQIAAVNFYLKKFEKAASIFQGLADRPNSPFKNVASYMVLRSKSNQILRGDGTGDAESVTAQLQKAADNAIKVSDRENILDLLRPISYLNLSAPEVAKTLAMTISDGTSKRFGKDVGDLTFLLDGNAPLSGLDVQGPTTSSSSASAEKPAAQTPKTDESKAADANTGEAKEENTSGKSSAEVAKVHDMTDFVCNMQKASYLTWYGSPEEIARAKKEDLQAARHAREMWGKTKSPAWLVAALSGSGLRLQDDKELYSAANNTPSSSAAYLTCKFYVVDSLIASGKREEARKILAPILSGANLPPTARNLFSTQMSAASESLPEYLKYSVLSPPEILSSNNDLVSAKFVKRESFNGFQTETPALDADMAADLSKNAPLSTWMQFAQSQNTPARFKPVIVRAAWTRAQLLEKSSEAAKLESALAATNPSLAAAVAKVKNAPDEKARQFAIACLVLRNYGMSPYLRGGAERHDEPIGEFDYYNNNFWVPLPMVDKAEGDDDSYYSYNNTIGYTGDHEVRDKMKKYWQPGLKRFLSNTEKKNADAERQLLMKNHPSRFFGQTVLEWAKTHPSDPNVPEMLYRIVKLPKWTEVTPVGSEYSKKAYLALHKAYPGNQWTKKAVCYY